MLKPEQIPYEVKLRLRNVLFDGETDEAVAIAAAINAWPGMREWQHCARCNEGPHLLLPPAAEGAGSMSEFSSKDYANGYRDGAQSAEATITTLRAEVEKLRAALEAWDNAVRVHVMMETPVFIGVSPTLGRLAWEKARAALEEKQ